MSLRGCISLSDIMCPKYRMVLFLNSHFPGFNFIPDSSINFNVSSSLLSCSSTVLPCIKISSIITWTPSMSPSNSVILRWKTSGAEDIPKGDLLKQNLPNDVIKVVSNRHSSFNGIWWNPLAGFNFENIFKLLNLDDTSFKFGWLKKIKFSSKKETFHSMSSTFFFSYWNNRWVPIRWFGDFFDNVIFL